MTVDERTTVDPFVLEILRHKLDTINDDAAAILMQVSGSQIAVEANDLNTVIMAADGRVVACGRYVLVQVASMHLFVRHLLDEYGDNPGINPGDQFVTNDPYVGTLHQPDVVVVAPVFDGDRLIAWCGSAIHEADVGGPTPGGMSYDASSIFDEALPMAP
ncbi:MAG TPA: hydantoinase B/oxoprolinase family protein, partial [Acidimicrobiales bacterium]